jgi:hypothetical protein
MTSEEPVKTDPEPVAVQSQPPVKTITKIVHFKSDLTHHLKQQTINF